MLNETDYQIIYDIVFQPDYPGYRPNQLEIPNGDGKADYDKRYAHVATKYLENYHNEDNKKILMGYLERAHNVAKEVADKIGLYDSPFYPDITRGALRILEYPPGSTSNKHVDFDLFTLMMYRNLPEYFQYTGEPPDEEVRKINKQIHYGKLLQAISENKIPACQHHVTASEEVQKSIVYFAIPPWESMLPSFETVGEWIDKEMSRTRINK